MSSLFNPNTDERLVASLNACFGPAALSQWWKNHKQFTIPAEMLEGMRNMAWYQSMIAKRDGTESLADQLRHAHDALAESENARAELMHERDELRAAWDHQVMVTQSLCTERDGLETVAGETAEDHKAEIESFREKARDDLITKRALINELAVTNAEHDRVIAAAAEYSFAEIVRTIKSTTTEHELVLTKIKAEHADEISELQAQIAAANEAAHAEIAKFTAEHKDEISKRQEHITSQIKAQYDAEVHSNMAEHRAVIAGLEAVIVADKTKIAGLESSIASEFEEKIAKLKDDLADEHQGQIKAERATYEREIAHHQAEHQVKLVMHQDQLVQTLKSDRDAHELEIARLQAELDAIKAATKEIQAAAAERIEELETAADAHVQELEELEHKHKIEITDCMDTNLRQHQQWCVVKTENSTLKDAADAHAQELEELKVKNGELEKTAAASSAASASESKHDR